MIKKVFLLFTLLAALVTLMTFHSHSGSIAGQSSISTDTTNTMEGIPALTDFNSIEFFNYRGEPIGFNYGFYKTINTLQVSKYDDLIREFSNNINWDWRLLASLICQESEFRPDVRSNAGAYGLMQIMPVTGRNFGIDIKASPENNIKAGILYITWLYSIFDPKISSKRERLYFILASYNAGPGHVLDAMRLAEKNGMNPQKWKGNVAVWLLKKSEPRYYNDSVVKNGYFRGKESVKFVAEVLDRFEHYKNIIPEEKSHPL